jgi:alpha-tubulin suppressor-like RCC1 family protein
MMRCSLPFVLRSALALYLLAFASLLTSPRALASAPAGLNGVVAIATGGSHSLALRADGTVWGWGTNSDWELGVTTPEGGEFGSETPVQATGLDQVRGIATGDDHGLAVRADGSVWAWGKNDHGQVGMPTGNCPYHDRPCSQVPIQVSGLSGIRDVAAAKDSSFALAADGTVRSWGDNGSGQLGTGAKGDSPSPVVVPGLSGVSAVSAAYGRVVALRGDGTVWGWGGGNSGSPTPVQIAGLEQVIAISAGVVHNLALTANGTVLAWGSRDSVSPIVVSGLEGVMALAGGGTTSAMVTTDGNLWSWTVGAAGAPPSPPVRVTELGDVVAVAIGIEGNLALRADGTVWIWRGAGSPQQVPGPAIAATPTA